MSETNEATDPDSSEPDSSEPDSSEPDSTEPDSTEPERTEPDSTGRESTDPVAKPSGLRNPPAAVRGVGAGTLVIEAVVLLLAIVPLHVLGVRSAGTAIACVVALAVVCVLLAGMLSRSWAWWGGIVVQILLIACGYFHVALGILGVLFLLLWIYVLSVRRTVLGR